MNDKKSFEELIQNNPTPVFVDFWAEWCAPCRMVAPTVQKIAEEMTGRVTVVKVNVDEKPHLAAQFGIQAIPTFALFKSGKIVHRFSGALPYDRMKSEIEKHLDTAEIIS